MPAIMVPLAAVGLALIGFVFTATARLSPRLRPPWATGDPLPDYVHPRLPDGGVMIGVTDDGDGGVAPLMWDG